MADFCINDRSKALRVLRTDDVQDSVVEKFLELTTGQFLNFKKAPDYYSRALNTLFFIEEEKEDLDILEYIAVMSSLLSETNIKYRGLSPAYPTKAFKRIEDMHGIEHLLNDKIYYIIGTGKKLEEELEIEKWLQHHWGERVSRPLFHFIKGWLEVFEEWGCEPFQPQDDSPHQLLKLIAPKHATPVTEVTTCSVVSNILKATEEIMSTRERKEVLMSKRRYYS